MSNADNTPAPNPTPDDALASAAEVLESAYMEVMRHEPQLRCFARALEDLGLPLSPNWARFDDERTVSFAPISAKQFRRLINVFEQIADRLPEPICPAPHEHDEPLFEIVTAQTAAENNTTSNSAIPDTEGD